VSKFVISHFLKYFFQCLMIDHSNFSHNLRGRSTKDSYTQWPISGRDPVTLTGSTSVLYEHVYFNCCVRHWTDAVFVRTLSCLLRYRRCCVYEDSQFFRGFQILCGSHFATALATSPLLPQYPHFTTPQPCWQIAVINKTIELDN